MVQLSPDTQVRHFKQSYPWAAGYRYEDDSILWVFVLRIFWHRSLGSRRRLY